LIERVARAGFGTLVLTVDTPVAANRENNVRAGFSTPLRPSFRLAWDGITHPRWLLGTFARTILRHGMPHFENNHATRGAPILSPNVERDFSDRGHLNWRHFALIRKQWRGRLVIKGILVSFRLADRWWSQAVELVDEGGRGGQRAALSTASPPVRRQPHRPQIHSPARRQHWFRTSSPSPRRLGALKPVPEHWAGGQGRSFAIRTVVGTNEFA
jgi:L-lactate dehydrogenase (cytochrome)